MRRFCNTLIVQRWGAMRFADIAPTGLGIAAAAVLLWHVIPRELTGEGRSAGVYPNPEIVEPNRVPTAFKEDLDRVSGRVTAGTEISEQSSQKMYYMLEAYLISRDPTYLFTHAGTALQASEELPYNPKSWMVLAKKSDEETAVQIIRWLLNQSQPSSTNALAAYWGNCIALGFQPSLTDGEINAIQIKLNSALSPLDTELMIEFASNNSIPAPFLSDFRDRILKDKDLSESISRMIENEPDIDRVRSLISLGDIDFQWKVATSNLIKNSSSAKAAASEVLLGQPSEQWITMLMKYADKSIPEFSASLATEWAQRQLNGNRLTGLEELLNSQKLTSVQLNLATILLQNAEDRESARAIAERNGIPWIPPKY
ncbi:hypothetical protein ACO0LD_30845 [Undibacterium sp. Ji83W]|uniref:hypothetical protein n=1 Tax=Undibacterium sp. Ji83W TaxID=3413043 RepID=UPI003BF0BE33